MATATLSYIFIRLLIANAGKLHLLDIPNGRSFHYSITPLGGGIGLGFIISILAVLSIKYIPPVVVLYLAAVPILDTLVVMIRRIKKRKSPFKPDKTHLHHIMVKFFNMNVKKTVIFLVILQIIFSSTGYVMLETMKKDSIGIAQLLALIGFVMMFFLFYMIFTNIKRRQLILDKEEE